MSVISIVCLCIDVILFIMRMRETPSTFVGYVDLIYGYTYIIFDAMLLIFTSKAATERRIKTN